MAQLSAYAGTAFTGLYLLGWQTPEERTHGLFKIPVAHPDSPFESIFVYGSGFTYAGGFPQSGKITTMYFGPQFGAIHQLSGLHHDAATVATFMLSGDE